MIGHCSGCGGEDDDVYLIHGICRNCRRRLMDIGIEAYLAIAKRVEHPRERTGPKKKSKIGGVAEG